MFVESNNKKDFAPLGATCGAAAYGAEARQESKFYISKDGFVVKAHV